MKLWFRGWQIHKVDFLKSHTTIIIENESFCTPKSLPFDSPNVATEIQSKAQEHRQSLHSADKDDLFTIKVLACNMAQGTSCQELFSFKLADLTKCSW